MLDTVRRLITEYPSAQRTPEWYRSRLPCITASSVSQVLPRSSAMLAEYLRLFPEKGDVYFPDPDQSCSPFGNRWSFFYNKIEPLARTALKMPPVRKETTPRLACDWGITFEPVAQRIYEAETGRTVHDVGFIPHPDHPFLGASPDGITDDGRLLEFKCPKSRPIDGTPPIYYAHQIWMQLECCDLEVCDYVEVKLKTFSSFQERFAYCKQNNIPAHRQGVFMQWTSLPYKSECLKFQHCVSDDIQTQISFIKQYQHTTYPKSPLREVIHWAATKVFIKEIPRSRAWFATALPELIEAHTALTKYIEDPLSLPGADFTDQE